MKQQSSVEKGFYDLPLISCDFYEQTSMTLYENYQNKPKIKDLLVNKKAMLWHWVLHQLTRFVFINRKHESTINTAGQEQQASQVYWNNYVKTQIKIKYKITTFLENEPWDFIKAPSMDPVKNGEWLQNDKVNQ